MLEKIKNNKYMIFLVAGIVAVALAIYGFSTSLNFYYNYIDNEYVTNSYKIQLLIDVIKNALIIIAIIPFIVIGRNRIMIKSALIISIVVYYFADTFDIIYDFIDGKDYSSLFLAALNVIIVIFAIISLTSKNYLFVTLVLLLIDAAFNLLSVFNGSVMGFAQFILCLLLISGIYFHNLESGFNTNNDTYYYN
jgi:hypothetical protein